MESKNTVIRIRHRLVVYFDKALRPALDKLALQSGLRRHGAPPCDAELARLLVIAQLLDGARDSVIVAAAIHSNAVVSLSRRLSALGHDLVPDLSLLVGERKDVGPMPAAPQPTKRSRQKGPECGRPRVCLVLDQWTHARLVDYASRRPEAYDGRSIPTENGKTRPCAEDMALVRGLLEAALRQWKYVLPIVKEYVKLMRHIESAIAGAVAAERSVIAATLSESLKTE